MEYFFAWPIPYHFFITIRQQIWYVLLLADNQGGSSPLRMCFILYAKDPMVNMYEIIIKKASIKNAEEILDLQKLAYVSEAEIINDFTIPPLHQTLEEIQFEFKHQIFLKIELDDRIIGSVRTYLKKETCHIGKLIVHPNNQNMSMGKKLLHAAEKQFPYAKRYELFTGHKSKKNLHIYQKNGYRIFKNKRISEKLSLVFLEKINSL